MPATYYVDTSALKWRYVQGPLSSEIDQLLDRQNGFVFTSELTIIEWSSALASEFRKGVIDQTQFKKYEIAFMTDIAKGKIEILPAVGRAVERGRYLIEFLGVTRGRSLKAGDALHLVYARDLATRIETRIHLVTCDSKFASAVNDSEALKTHIVVDLLSPE